MPEAKPEVQGVSLYPRRVGRQVEDLRLPVPRRLHGACHQRPPQAEAAVGARDDQILDPGADPGGHAVEHQGDGTVDGPV